MTQKNKTMQNEVSQEKKFIELIYKNISSELQIRTPDCWQQRDFENLSLLIEEKTGIKLSISTIKRTSKNQFLNIPQKNTLNALAQFLDYKDWYDFKIKNPLQETIQIKKAKKTLLKWNKKIIYFPAAAIMAFLILLLILNSKSVQSYSEAKFSSRKNVSEGLPNTVIFDYDISMYDFDSAFIQQSWDIRRRAEIKKNKKYSTSVYYYPGFHQAKLLINDQLVKEIPVYITTKDWLSLIQNPNNEIIPIYVNENCISDGRIFIPPETIEKYNIDLADNNHTTSFYFVDENFKGDSDNFTFETRIKNNLNEGGIVCQTCEISILNEMGRHLIQFCNPGCIGSINLNFGWDYISGKNNDLSAFGTDLNLWNDVKMEFKNKIVTIFLNGNEIYKTSYENSNGYIKGVSFQFAGSGSIDYARLYDSAQKLVFSEDFE